MGVTEYDSDFPAVDGHSERAIARIRSLEQQIARLQALQLKEIAAYHTYRGGARDVAAELALTLSIGDHAAQKKLDLANSLVHRLPYTLTAMEFPYCGRKCAAAGAQVISTPTRRRKSPNPPHHYPTTKPARSMRSWPSG